MKTRNVLLLFVIGLIIWVGLFFGWCWYDVGIVESRESDIEKYPELQIFIYQMESFYGAKHEATYGPFEFSYSSFEKNPEIIFSIIDKNAMSNGWKILRTGDFERVYSMNLKRFPAQTHEDKIFLSYDGYQKTIRVFWL